MNPLLWAFISLQLSAPLPNIDTLVQPRIDTAYPGYHYPNPPGGSSLLYTVKDSRLWSCDKKCSFHNGLATYGCRHILDNHHKITCIQWKGLLI